MAPAGVVALIMDVAPILWRLLQIFMGVTPKERVALVEQTLSFLDKLEGAEARADEMGGDTSEIEGLINAGSDQPTKTDQTVSKDAGASPGEKAGPG